MIFFTFMVIEDFIDNFYFLKDYDDKIGIRVVH